MLLMLHNIIAADGARILFGQPKCLKKNLNPLYC